MRIGPYAIFETGLRRLRREFGFALIPAVLGAATLVVGGISWGLFVIDHQHLAPKAYHSSAKSALHTFVYGALRTVSDFAPSVWNVNEGNWGTDLAAILGAATFYASVFLIVANVMSETMRRVAARFVYRSHVVIVGETALASRLTKVWRRRVSQVVQIVAGGGRPPRGSAQVRSMLDESLFVRFALGRAAAVFIDLGDDMTTLSLAYDLAMKSIQGSRAAPTRHAKPTQWAFVVRDQTLIEQFSASLSKATGTGGARPGDIRYFSPERAIVRRFLASRPLLPDEGDEAGVHVLVVGYGAAADELVQAIFLTGLVSGRAWPRVTVLSADCAKDRSVFFSRRPGLVGEIDVAFLPRAALDDFEPVALAPPARTDALDRTLFVRDAERPVGAVFLTSAEPDENSRLAIKLRDIQTKTGRLGQRIFAVTTLIVDEDDARPSEFGRTLEGLETIGLTDEFLDEEFCRPNRRATLAASLHENYRATSGGPSWEELSETKRRSNGNAADHCLAKLHMLGFEVSTVPAGVIPRIGPEDLVSLNAALRQTPLRGPLLDLVVLEHDRWSLERRFEGWIYAPSRNDASKRHHLLVPWDALTQEQQDQDRDQIEGLLKCLASSGDRNFELARKPTDGVGAQRTEP